MRGDGAPTVGVAVAGLAIDYYLGIGKLVIETYEGFAIGIEALDRGVYMVERIMVATLTVLGLVIDGATLDLDFASREITLEILHIGSSIPQAPLLEREQFEVLNLVALVGECELLYLGPLFEGNEEQHAGLDTILATSNAGVAHTMTALVEIEWSFAGLPTWVPNGVAILDIKVSATIVHGNIVVTITGDTAELGILVE